MHLEQQGAVKIKSWRRNKTPKKSPEPKCAINRKLTSNALLESLSVLDLPTSSTSDSMPSSSTSPVLSDMTLRLTQDITSMENLKQTVKPSRITKNKKTPIQTMQTTDNAVELNIKCPTVIDQNNIENSQMFAMPVSNNISTVTPNNSSTISTSNIISQSIASNITNQTISSNMTTNQPIVSNITSQPIVSNITSQSIISNITSQSIASNITSQPIASNITSQSIASNITGQSISSSFSSQLISSNIGQSIANNITSQLNNNHFARQSFANNIINKSIANTSLKLNTQTVANSGQVINIAQTKSSNNQTLVSNSKMVVNSIPSNVCNFNDKQLLSPGDLLTIANRTKTKHVQISQPVTIGQSSGMLYLYL